MNNDDPGRMVSRLLWQTAYNVHPYRFPVIGCENIFQGLNREDLLKFFHRHYTPDNLIVSIAGDVAAEDVRKVVEEKFSRSAIRARPPCALPSEPPQLTSRFERKPGAYNVSRLEMAWHTVGLSHADAPALDMLAIITGSGNSSRLNQKIKEDQKKAYSIDAWSYTLRQEGLFGISAVFHPTNEISLVKAIENEIASWRSEAVDGDDKDVGSPPRPAVVSERRGIAGDRSEDGHAQARPLQLFSPAEVESARKKAMADTLLAFQTIHGQAEVFASGEFYAGSPRYFAVYLERLSRVTPESLTAVARKYLTDANRTLVILSPALTNAPAAGKHEPAQEIKVVKNVLTNGLTVLCREDKRLPFIHMTIASLGGLLLESKTNNGINCLMVELLRRGTAKRGQEQIAREVESKGGTLSSFSGMNSYGLQAKCFATDAEVFMEIMSDCYLNPAFTDDETAKCKTVQISRIAQEREAPLFLAQEAARKALFPNHPYSLNVQGEKESVAGIQRAELAGLHAKTCLGSNTVIALFGDITPAKALEMAQKYFGGMRKGERLEWETKDMVGRALAASPSICGTSQAKALHETKQTSNKSELKALFPRRITLTAPREQTIVLFGYPGLAVTDGRMDALKILLESLNGLSSDLLIKVRDKRGLAYYTGAYHRAGLVSGQFALYSGTRADQCDQVAELINKEIKRICGAGLRADEFERAREQVISESRKKSQSNGPLAMECALNELYGLGYAYGLEIEKRVRRLKADDVRAAAAEIMRPEKAVEVVVKPDKENAEGRRQNEKLHLKILIFDTKLFLHSTFCLLPLLTRRTHHDGKQ
jgi:zinc protease